MQMIKLKSTFVISGKTNKKNKKKRCYPACDKQLDTNKEDYMYVTKLMTRNHETIHDKEMSYMSVE